MAYFGDATFFSVAAILRLREIPEKKNIPRIFSRYSEKHPTDAYLFDCHFRFLGVTWNLYSRCFLISMQSFYLPIHIFLWEIFL